MILRDFPLCFMEALKCWRSLHGCAVVFMFLTTVSRGSACEAPSSPLCFRRTSDESMYICEWSMNTTDHNVTFELFVGEENFKSEKNTRELKEEDLIRRRPVDIYVEALVGNATCRSTSRSVVLENTVKYEAPQNISMSWLKGELSLRWRAPETHPALAEVRVQRDGHLTWENRPIQIKTNATNGTYTYKVNLLKNSSHQVHIRHRSTKVSNPLWSEWSFVIVPAALEEKPEVTEEKHSDVNGTRRVVLMWKPMPHAAAVIMYKLKDSSHECPCLKKEAKITGNKHTTYVSYSAVNISVTAVNAAGSSPPAIVQLHAHPAANFESRPVCDKTLLNTKLMKNTCLEFFELQNKDSRLGAAITLTARKTKPEQKEIKEKIKDNVRYLYFEHRCAHKKPQTVKMCLFYQKEDVPREPQLFTASAETESSVQLSWEEIPIADQRGFLTHYRLCSMKINPQDESKKCYNVSASTTKYILKNLTPGAKYNITLAGVTGAGEGSTARVAINTLPEKPVNVWWSLALLLVFFLFPTLCTFMLKRVKNKIFPPVPKPVIKVFTSYPAEAQEMLEGKEEVHDLTLQQIHPESKGVPEDSQETKTLCGGEWDEGTDEDEENERESGGSDDECLSPSSTDQPSKSCREEAMTDLAQVENEIAMLIYRNGLVFDVKTDST